MAWILANQDKIEVTYFCVASEQIGVNVVHYDVSAVVGTPTYEELADDLTTSVADDFKPWLSDNANYSGLKIRLVGETPAPAPVYTAGGAGVGTGGATLPRQLAGLIRKRLDLAGPQGRGRMYVPFPGADMQENGAVSAAGQAQLGLIRAAVFGAAGSIALTPGTGSCTLAPVLWNRATDSFSGLVSTQISPQFATQLRRGYFGRPNALPAELT